MGITRLISGCAVAMTAVTHVAATPAQAVTHPYLDTRFGTGGKVVADFGGTEEAWSAVVANGTAVYTAGWTGHPAATDFLVAKYTATGKLDATFGTRGVVKTDFGDSDQAKALLRQPDGKLVAVGTAYHSDFVNPDFAIARYNLNGTLDTTFGTGGKVTTDLGADEDGRAAALQADGKIVVAGVSADYATALIQVAVARYNANGTLDKTFGTGGIAKTTIGDSNEAYGSAVAVQSDGKVVVAGQTLSSGSYNFALARYTKTGALDSTFGSGGKVITDLGAADDHANALAISSTGTILAAGTTDNFTTSDFALVRYQSNGKLDTAFGIGGVRKTDLGGTGEAVNSVVLTDTTIVAGGTSAGNFALATYTTSRGTLTGTTTTDLAGNNDSINALTLYGDGQVIAAGLQRLRSGTFASDTALARYYS